MRRARAWWPSALLLFLLACGPTWAAPTGGSAALPAPRLASGDAPASAPSAAPEAVRKAVAFVARRWRAAVHSATR
jgi:hypothetical protein